MQGISLFKDDTHPFIYSEGFSPFGNIGYSLIRDNMKLLNVETEDKSESYLFDIATDAFEKKNLALEKSDLMNDMKKIVDSLKIERRIVKKQLLPDRMLDNLRQLGYIR
jgi:hypothetical protein